MGRIRETQKIVRGTWCHLIVYKNSVCFILHPYLALLNAPRPANNNTVIVGVLFGGVAIGVVAVLLVLGIVCGVYKLRKWKKQPTLTETDTTAENKSVAHFKCFKFVCKFKFGTIMPEVHTSLMYQIIQLIYTYTDEM